MSLEVEYLCLLDKTNLYFFTFSPKWYRRGQKQKLDQHLATIFYSLLIWQWFSDKNATFKSGSKFLNISMFMLTSTVWVLDCFLLFCRPTIQQLIEKTIYIIKPKINLSTISNISWQRYRKEPNNETSTRTEVCAQLKAAH